MEKKGDHRPDFKRPEKSFFPISLCLSTQKRFLVDAENQLQSTCGMGAGWYQLEIQALELCASREEERIMWCSTNQPMPDSHSVERYLASKEDRTCDVVGMMSANIEN